MNPLLSILRHSHCRSTHHHFAVDSIDLIKTDAGNRLAQILVRYHDHYLRGAKDPDTRFRDFQNHVIHVTDGYWGGAPRVAHQWYDRMQRYLRENRLDDAAHAAGVISHYFTDPMMPLHTQQCVREKILHRPIEWSVTKSYASIMKLWRDDQMRVIFELSNDPGWLGEAILHGARHANQYYFPLMDTYDLGRGRKNPASGLSLIAKQALAEMFGLAVTGWARVLERAAADAEGSLGQPLPKVSTTVSALLATSRIPIRLILKRIQNKKERIAVEALIQEFEQTGDVKENLSTEVDIVHRVIKVRADEVAWQQRRKQLDSRRTVLEVVHTNEAPENHHRITPEVPARLALSDALVDAPSIGPRTAARFKDIGIETVEQFLDASPQTMAKQLATNWISTSKVALWQKQATLMCDVPGLSCLAAQMIAATSCSNRSEVAKCTPESLHRDVTAYAKTSAGRRYLRRGTPPSLSDVAMWVRHASLPVASDRGDSDHGVSDHGKKAA